MTDRPILFSGPMVRALLAGTKTQTRRVIKAGGDAPQFCGGRYDGRNDLECWGWEDCEWGGWITLDQWKHWNFVRYRVGDRLYVREAWRTTAVYDAMPPRNMDDTFPVRFEAYMQWRNHGSTDTNAGRFRQGMHMPRWASRLTLTVTDVRVQRVQDISYLDTCAEGVDCETCAAMGQSACYRKGCGASREAFRNLWDSLNEPRGYGWSENPWVAAYTFTVRHRNIDAKEGRT